MLKQKSIIICSIVFCSFLFSVKTTKAACSWDGNVGTVASPYNYTDVDDCGNDAKNKTGEVTINIPAATVAWSTNPIIDMRTWTTPTKLILKGAGKELTNISGAGISLYAATDIPIEVKNIGLSEGALRINNSVDFLVHDMKLSSALFSYCVSVGNADRLVTHPAGVIYNNEFHNCGVGSFAGAAMLTDSNVQSVLWSDQPGLGDANAVYVEGNSYYANSTSTAIEAHDSNYSGRTVFRFNSILTDSASTSAMVLGTHSVQASSHRAMQRWEIYNNVFDNERPSGGYTPAMLRAGTGVAFNNSILGHWTNYSMILDNVRSAWDYRGTHNGSDNASSLAAESYSIYAPAMPPQTVNYIGALLENKTDGSECLVTSYTDETATCTLGGGTENDWDNGDVYRVTRPALVNARPCDGSSTWDGNEDATGYPCRDQIGRGYDATFWEYNPAGAYNQVLMPVYAWDNKKADNTQVNFIATSAGSNADHIKAERDFYNYNASFNGTTGVGRGTLANRPSTCTKNVGYWSTDNNTLYQCSLANTWTAYYTPRACPDPRTGLTGSCNFNVSGAEGYPVQSALDTTPPSTPSGLAVN